MILSACSSSSVKVDPNIHFFYHLEGHSFLINEAGEIMNTLDPRVFNMGCAPKEVWIELLNAYKILGRN